MDEPVQVGTAPGGVDLRPAGTMGNAAEYGSKVPSALDLIDGRHPSARNHPLAHDSSGPRPERAVAAHCADLDYRALFQFVFTRVGGWRRVEGVLCRAGDTS